MITKPLFSIIIPLYNKAEYICMSIDSILSQTFQNFEIIIVDDGSTDSSFSIVQNHYQLNRVRLLQQANAGPAAARNTGVKNAIGEWVLFLDADDVLLPDALDTFAKLIKEHIEIKYIICNYFIQCDGKKFLFQHMPIEGIVKNPFLLEFAGWLSDRPGSAIYKKELALQFPFNENLRRYEDAECQYEMLKHVGVYQSKKPVMISNRDASEAASYRKDMNEDFLGHLKFEGKSFWERMMLYKLARQAVEGYGAIAIEKYQHHLDMRVYKMVFFLFRSLWILEKVLKKILVSPKNKV